LTQWQGRGLREEIKRQAIHILLAA
jgi:hypothetical protein